MNVDDFQVNSGDAQNRDVIVLRPSSPGGATVTARLGEDDDDNGGGIDEGDSNNNNGNGSNVISTSTSSSLPPNVMPKRCRGCSEPILDRFLLQAMDSYWHTTCLRCSTCRAVLGEVGATCYTRGGLVLCRNDYIR
jgi:hypothetical protein